MQLSSLGAKVQKFLPQTGVCQNCELSLEEITLLCIDDMQGMTTSICEIYHNFAFFEPAKEYA